MKDQFLNSPFYKKLVQSDKDQILELVVYHLIDQIFKYYIIKLILLMKFKKIKLY